MASIFKRKNENDRPRSVSLANLVIKEIQKLNSSRNQLKSLVFASKTAFGRIDIKKAWQQALKRAGIFYCRAHDIRRHTFCTLAASQEASNLELATAPWKCSKGTPTSIPKLQKSLANTSPNKFSKETLYDSTNTSSSQAIATSSNSA